MYYAARPGIPFRIIPYKSEASDTVQIEVLEREIAERQIVLIRVSYCTLIAENSRHLLPSIICLDSVMASLAVISGCSANM